MLTNAEHSGRKKTTRREELLKSTNAIIPWEAWIEKIRPHYPPGKRGSPLKSLSISENQFRIEVSYKHKCKNIWLQTSAIQKRCKDSFIRKQSNTPHTWRINFLTNKGYFGRENRSRYFLTFTRI